MNTVGEKITELRKSKSMTQEDLANIIGVSAQSISKWENNATMPDIMLLPVIADIFDVSIDTLFGRGVKKVEKLPFNDVYDIMKENFLITIQKSFYDENEKITFDERMEECRNQLNKMQYSQTGILCGKNGAVYYSEETGGVLLPKKENNWSDLLNNSNINSVINCLKDECYCTVLRYVWENPKASFTAASITNKYSISKMMVENTLNELVNQNFLVYECVDTGETKLNIYRSMTENNARFLLLFIAMTYLKRFVEYKPHFYAWCG